MHSVIEKQTNNSISECTTYEKKIASTGGELVAKEHDLARGSGKAFF
jgi:uncharacterized Rmd1/YagE family protein